MYFSEQGNVDDGATIFLVSFNLQSVVCSLWSAVCGLQSAVCGLRSAVCSLQSANVIHRLGASSWCIETIHFEIQVFKLLWHCNRFTFLLHFFLYFMTFCVLIYLTDRVYISLAFDF